MDAIFFDQALGQYGVLNGNTISTDVDFSSVTVRRVFDNILADLYINLQWAKSQPNNPRLRSRITDSADAYLRTLLRNEVIANYGPSVCNDSNNTVNDFQNHILNVTITYTPLYPADFIYASVVRQLQAPITIQTG
jgi:phage tail sheath protein FI